MPLRSALGTTLIIFGVAAWIVYFGLKFLTPLDPPIGYFLIWHLSGVIPGVALRGSKLIPKLVAVFRRD